MNPTGQDRPVRIAVVIPAYRVRKHIAVVLERIPSWVDHVFVTDDCCPEQTGKFVAESCTDPRVRVLFHKENQGVGGATTTGYRAALEVGCDIVVKMDGDDQMDPTFLPRLINPILVGKADFTKGNRFYDLEALRRMPLVRRVGNLGLTLLTKAASGYWNISDPTNGYTAVNAAALHTLSLDRLARRYFFETSMLIQLNTVRAIAFDVPIPARYGSEQSSLSVTRSLFGFPPRLLRGFFRRMLWRYFIYDISAVTVLLLVGGVSMGFGVSFGVFHWIQGYFESQTQSAGTVALALLPTLLGFQMLLQAVLLDVVDRPLTSLGQLVCDRPKQLPSALVAKPPSS